MGKDVNLGHNKHFLPPTLPPDANLYGLGEHSDDFRFDTDGDQRVSIGRLASGHELF